MQRSRFVIVATGALLSVLAVAAPATAADARTPNSNTLPFCTALLSFDAGWPQVNLDHPGQPFFNDGNADGIADLLQIGRAKLPSLGSGLDTLATQAPSNLRSGLRTLATDVQKLAKERAPATAAQSSQEVKPVEQVASRLQRDLRGTGCLAKVTAANAAADQAEGGASGFSGQGNTSAVVLVFLLVNLPLILTVWRHRRRPAVKQDGSGFTGKLRRWKIDTTTGPVVDYQPHPVTRTIPGGPDGHGGYLPSRTVTTLTEVVRLDPADGPDRDPHLVNFEAYPTRGDMVTVCVARKRSKGVTFALLNHTTRKQDVQLQELFTVTEGGTARQVIMVFGLIFGGLVTAFVAVFGGALWLIAVWLGLVVMFVVTIRREASIDTRPLWRRANAQREMLPV
jgi:hypothetical protein